MKKTLVLGATTNPDRYAYIATKKLLRYNHPVVLVGQREGEIAGEKILTGTPSIDEVDTITLYVGVRNLPPFFDYIIGLKPKRVLFNPGTENPDLIRLCKENGIEIEIGCTLVMLSAGTY